MRLLLSRRHIFVQYESTLVCENGKGLISWCSHSFVHFIHQVLLKAYIKVTRDIAIGPERDNSDMYSLLPSNPK